MTVGEAMKKAREEAGLTVPNLSAITGISSAGIYQYEKDINKPRIDTAEILADALGISIDEYVGHGEHKSRTLSAEVLKLLRQQARVDAMKELGEKVMEFITDTVKAERRAE